MQSFAKEVFIPMLQEGNLSLAKHAFQISNSGCQVGCQTGWEGCSVLPQLSLPACPTLTANSTEGIHCSQLVPGYLVRHCVRSPGSLLEVETLIVKPVEGAEGQSKALGQVGNLTLCYLPEVVLVR